MPGQANTIFITPQYLRDNTIINDNVDGQLIQPAILTSQDKYLQPILGSNLYSAMKIRVTASTITGVYKTLMDEYIVPTLTQYTVWELVPFMAFKFRNKGIQKQSSPDSTPADLTELYYVRDNILSTAQFYGQRMIDYLCANSGSFPEYNQGIVNGDGMIADKNQFFNGIHIPGSNRGDCTRGYGFTYPVDL